MLKVIVDQLPLGVGDGRLDRVKLLGEVNARPTRFEHRNHRRQVALRSFQADENFGVARVLHGHILPRRIGRVKLDPLFSCSGWPEPAVARLQAWMPMAGATGGSRAESTWRHQ